MSEKLDEEKGMTNEERSAYWMAEFRKERALIARLERKKMEDGDAEI